MHANPRSLLPAQTPDRNEMMSTTRRNVACVLSPSMWDPPNTNTPAKGEIPELICSSLEKSALHESAKGADFPSQPTLSPDRMGGGGGDVGSSMGYVIVHLY